MDPRYPWARDNTPSPDDCGHLPTLPSSSTTSDVTSSATESNDTPSLPVASSPVLAPSTASASIAARAPITMPPLLNHSVAVAMLEGRPFPSKGAADRRMSIADPTTRTIPSLPIINRLRRYSSSSVGPAPLRPDVDEGAGFGSCLGTLANSHDHLLVHAQLCYQTETQAHSQAGRLAPRLSSPAIVSPSNTPARNQLQARRVYSGASIPSTGAFLPRSRSTSLSVHPEDPEHDLPLAPPNTRRSSIVPGIRRIGGGISNAISPHSQQLDEGILGTSRPPAHMRSSSAWYIPQNLERLELSNTPNQRHPHRQRRVSFTAVDSETPCNTTSPIPPGPSFDIGARRTSESVSSDAGRLRRRRSSAMSSLFAMQLEGVEDDITSTDPPAWVGQGVKPRVSTPMRKVENEGEGYESEAENEAHPMSVRRSRRKSSGVSPGNRDTPQFGVSAHIQSEGLRACSHSPSATQVAVPVGISYFSERVKCRPVFTFSPGDMESRIHSNNTAIVGPNNANSAQAPQNTHFSEESTPLQLFTTNDIAPDELTVSTIITTAIAIPSSTTTKGTPSSSSFKGPIPEVFNLKKFAPGDFPENIDGITSCESKDASPAQTIVRRNSWSDEHDQAEGHMLCLAGQDREHASPLGQLLHEQRGGGKTDTADAAVEHRDQGEHSDSGSTAGTISTNKMRDKGKSRAVDIDIEDKGHRDITPLAKPRKRTSSTSTVIRDGNYFTDTFMKAHQPRPKHEKVKPRAPRISCVPTNDRHIRQPTSIYPPLNTPAGRPPRRLSLDVLNPHEHAVFERLLEEHRHPGIRELAQFSTQLPTLDQLREYHTFDDFNTGIRGDDSEEEAVGFLKRAVQAMGVYFCCCITSRKKEQAKRRDFVRRTTPSFDEGSEYSSGGDRVSNSQRRARMKNYGTIIERNLSSPAPAKLSIGLFIPGQRPNNSTEVPGSGSLEGEIRPEECRDVPTRWLYHPAYEVDMEDPGDYAYISEESAPNATSIWRGHVRHRVLLASQEEQREEACHSRRAREEARGRQHQDRFQQSKKRTMSEATMSGSIFSVSTAPLLVGEHSIGGENEHVGAESEFDGGDEADTEYTDDDTTLIVVATSDESEEWDLGSTWSGWSFPGSVNSRDNVVPTVSTAATPSHNLYSTISTIPSLGSLYSNYFARPVPRSPSGIYNIIARPCLSGTLAPGGGTNFPASKDSKGHGYLVQELRTASCNGFSDYGSSSSNTKKYKSVYPEGLPAGSMSSRTTSYGSYLASTSGGARDCFQTNIRDFGATSIVSPLLASVGARKVCGQAFGVIEADTSIETYMHRKPPTVYRSVGERSSKGKFNLADIREHVEVRAKIKRECKAGREKLEKIYPGVIGGIKQVLAKDFDGEQESDMEEM